MTTTTEITTAAAPILAIDLGKYKSVACVYRSADEHRFHSIPTSRDELARRPRRDGRREPAGTRGSARVDEAGALAPAVETTEGCG